MIASFNYYGPSTITFVISICVAIAVLVPLFFTRSVLRGIFGGAISWGLIAIIVFGAGRGDMTNLLQMVWGVICAVAGAVAGLIAGLLGKSSKAKTSQTMPVDGQPVK